MTKDEIKEVVLKQLLLNGTESVAQMFILLTGTSDNQVNFDQSASVDNIGAGIGDEENVKASLKEIFAELVSDGSVSTADEEKFIVADKEKLQAQLAE